jgi:hypothetical protein
VHQPRLEPSPCRFVTPQVLSRSSMSVRQRRTSSHHPRRCRLALPATPCVATAQKLASTCSDVSMLRPLNSSTTCSAYLEVWSRCAASAAGPSTQAVPRFARINCGVATPPTCAVAVSPWPASTKTHQVQRPVDPAARKRRNGLASRTAADSAAGRIARCTCRYSASVRISAVPRSAASCARR